MLTLIRYFEDLIYGVDRECQLYCRQEDEKSEASIQACDDQSVIVDAIKSHETACFAKMPTNEFDEEFGVVMEERIKNCEVKMERIGPWGEHEWFFRHFIFIKLIVFLKEQI